MEVVRWAQECVRYASLCARVWLSAVCCLVEGGNKTREMVCREAAGCIECFIFVLWYRTSVTMAKVLLILGCVRSWSFLVERRDDDGIGKM